MSNTKRGYKYHLLSDLVFYLAAADSFYFSYEQNCWFIICYNICFNFEMCLQTVHEPKLMLGSTVEPLAALPAANRKDPQLAPPSITEDDARHGILSLLERGLIPPGADLAFEPSPVKHKLAQIYTSEDRNQEKTVIAGIYYLHLLLALLVSGLWKRHF